MKKIELDEFTRRAKTLLKEIEIIKYNGYNKKSEFKCKIHGVFFKTPKNFLIHQCNKCTNEKLHLLYVKDKETFLKQATKIFPNYDYSETNYYNDETEIIVICKEHGEFKTTPNRLLSKHECPKCADKKRTSLKTYTLNELKERAKLLNYNYDYSKANEIGIYNSVEIICKKHGSFFMTWNNHLNCKQKCPSCFSSFGELETEKFLNKKSIKFSKTKIFKNLIDINKLSYDFYLEDRKILIECQGQQHYYNSFNKPLHEWHRQLHHDWLKRKYAKDNNFNLIIVPYWEYKNINNFLEVKLNELR